MARITIDGLKINYQNLGQGPTILLLHGWGSSWRLWARTMSRLAQAGYHACAVDLIGFGDSDKPATEWYSIEHYTYTLEAFCDRLQLEQPAIVGHSMGGTIALHMAARCGARAVIAAAPLVHVETSTMLRTLLHSDAARRLFEWMRRRAIVDALGDRSLWGVPGLMRNPARKRNQQDLRRTTVRAAVGSLRAVTQVNLETHLTRIAAPTLIVVGGRDMTVSPEQGRRAARFIPNARLVSWPDVGHQLIDDRGDEFDHLVLEEITRADVNNGKLRAPI